ncbi:1,6-anhydro-N-acetylmuramyl-L-alanine amidase AmpD [Candidatus Pandoraea novymonadis]|uniref:1,6-anhydro-N-acetylmuramyl-L-alanine amidase AmpD n=1 Tax=Candidatus Pandoraea novymonadis TaxID=1808959 RepID=A0ABX5FFY5_9BURK|nr:1,6-anhydro-N-acetylmuramyl-L-alanine amidase AmpD [Candidatus Pandoraea novymonadis]PSB92383.1 1,6-anhydro-N-acetylmuramyl-L-alanine amidase AmpD [Candidatus Pandoraea novymonadis]
MTALFKIDNDGWAYNAERIPSPNFDERPKAMAIDLLVVHNISLPHGQFGGNEIADFFCNKLDNSAHPIFNEIRDLHVSAHFLVRRTGRVQQFVSCNARAWHAGVSSFQGRKHCNDFSIGIEVEGSDHLPFEKLQYKGLAKLTLAIFARYSIQAIVGHADIAPGRKTDPGPYFDWMTLRDLTDLPGKIMPYQCP